MFFNSVYLQLQILLNNFNFLRNNYIFYLKNSAIFKAYTNALLRVLNSCYLILSKSIFTCLGILIILLKLLLKIVRSLVSPKAKRIYLTFIVITYIMCPYVRLITIKAIFKLSAYTLDLYLFWDVKLYDIDIFTVFGYSFYRLFLILKLLPSAIYKIMLLHVTIFYNTFSTNVDYVSYILSNKFINFYSLFVYNFCKQFVYISNIMLYLLNENSLCMRKYYRFLIGFLFLIIFIIIELQKNFFFLKKKIILSNGRIKFNFIYSSTFIRFFNFKKTKIFKSNKNFN